MAQDDGNAADDLNSAFAARLRAVSGSDKPSELRASEQAAAMRAKAEAARRRADSVKSDAADFLAGGKKQVAAGRGYDGDDLAEVPWYDSSDMTFIGGAAAVLIAAFVGSNLLTQWDDADRQLVATAQTSNPKLSRCIDNSFSRREVRDCKAKFGPS